MTGHQKLQDQKACAGVGKSLIMNKGLLFSVLQQAAVEVDQTCPRVKCCRQPDYLLACLYDLFEGSSTPFHKDIITELLTRTLLTRTSKRKFIQN